MSESQPIRVFIVDDHAMVRNGLRNFIQAFEWMATIGEAATGAEALAFCKEQDVDVVLMDLVMPGMNGTQATKEIISLDKGIKIIILTSFQEQDYVEQALRAGAMGYLLKNVSAVELAQAIQAAHAGRPALSPEATQALINVARDQPELGSDLTEREVQVLGLLVKGQSNSQIAAHLNITEATVKFHLANIYNKLGVSNRVEAVTTAVERKLVKKE